MNVALVLASRAIIATACVTHSTLGELRLIGPLLAPEVRRGLLEESALARQVLRLSWHLTSVAWFGLAAVLVAEAAARPSHLGDTVASLVAATFFVTGLTTLLASRGRLLVWPSVSRHRSPVRAPGGVIAGRIKKKAPVTPIVATKVPADSALQSWLGEADFYDAWEAPLDDGSLSPTEVFLRCTSATPSGSRS